MNPLMIVTFREVDQLDPVIKVDVLSMKQVGVFKMLRQFFIIKVTVCSYLMIGASAYRNNCKQASSIFLLDGWP